MDLNSQTSQLTPQLIAEGQTVTLDEILGGAGVADSTKSSKESRLIQMEMLWYLTAPKSFKEYFLVKPHAVHKDCASLVGIPTFLGRLIIDYYAQATENRWIKTVAGNLVIRSLKGSSVQTVSSSLKTDVDRMFKGRVPGFVNPFDTIAAKTARDERMKATYLGRFVEDEEEAADTERRNGSSFIDENIWSRRIVAVYRTIRDGAKLHPSADTTQTIRLRMLLLMSKILMDLAHAGRPEETAKTVFLESSLLVPVNQRGEALYINETTGLPDFVVLHIPEVDGTNKKTISTFKRVYANPKNRAFCWLSYVVFACLEYFIPNDILEGPLFADYAVSMNKMQLKKDSWGSESYVVRMQRLYKAAEFNGCLPNARTARATGGARAMRSTWGKDSQETIVKEHMGHDQDADTYKRYVHNVEQYVSARYGGVEKDPLGHADTDIPFNSSRHGKGENYTSNNTKPLIVWLKDHVDAGLCRDIWSLEP